MSFTRKLILLTVWIVNTLVYTDQQVFTLRVSFT